MSPCLRLRAAFAFSPHRSDPIQNRLVLGRPHHRCLQSLSLARHHRLTRLASASHRLDYPRGYVSDCLDKRAFSDRVYVAASHCYHLQLCCTSLLYHSQPRRIFTTITTTTPPHSHQLNTGDYIVASWRPAVGAITVGYTATIWLTDVSVLGYRLEGE